MAGALMETVQRGLEMRRPRGLETDIPGAARRGAGCLDPSAPRPRAAPAGRWRPRARHVALTLHPLRQPGSRSRAPESSVRS